MKNARRNILIGAFLTLTCGVILQAAEIPPGKSVYSVELAALPDRSLVGKKVDVVARRVYNNSAIAPLVKVVLQDVLLISSPEYNEWGASSRRATLALSAAEEKKLTKIANKVGVDIILQSRQSL